jgi:uroporphyrinogen III methyltransferase/synthase
VVEPETFAPVDAALAELARYEWCLFTSVNGVEAVWKRLGELGRDTRVFGSSRVAAVGPATADALRARGIVADLVPPEFNADTLVRSIGVAPSSSRQRVLLVQPADARDEIARALDANEWRTDVAAVYRTVVDESSVESGQRALSEGVDAVLFTSGSTVRSFVELWGPPPEGAVVCCIGPRTAEACAEARIRVDAVAAEQTIDALVAALIGSCA